MYAIQQHDFGGPEVLVLEEVPDAVPGDGEVVIRVEAAGVHLLDTMVRRGESTGPGPLPSLPMIPGREVAGFVGATGPGVTGIDIGTAVVASLPAGTGGYAESAVTPADSLHVLPDGFDPHVAVAMIGTGATTMAILELADPDATDVAVVTGAAGGIGTLLIQALNHLGAIVVGAASGAHKTALIHELGATAAVDYSSPGWTDSVRDALHGRPVTLALDGVGGSIGRSALELVGVGGRVVMYGSASGQITSLSAADLYARGIGVAAAVGARLALRTGGLRQLQTGALDQVAAGRLRPIIGQVFALEAAAEAHAAIESRVATGKTLLVPAHKPSASACPSPLPLGGQG